MKLLYNFDPVFGFFTGVTEARESPLEPGVFLMPAGATEIEAPQPAAGQAAVFDGSAWQIITDNRGAWFNAQHQVRDVADPRENMAGCTRTPPPDPDHDLVDGLWVPSPQRQARTAQLQLTEAVQRRLDQMAAGLGYDDMRSAVTYADEPAVAKFQTEGRALRAWRSLVWERCYELLDEVLAGTRAVPTAQELIALLPALELPS